MWTQMKVTFLVDKGVKDVRDKLHCRDSLRVIVRKGYLKAQNGTDVVSWCWDVSCDVILPAAVEIRTLMDEQNCIPDEQIYRWGYNIDAQGTMICMPQGCIFQWDGGTSNNGLRFRWCVSRGRWRGNSRAMIASTRPRLSPEERVGHEWAQHDDGQVLSLKDHDLTAVKGTSRRAILQEIDSVYKLIKPQPVLSAITTLISRTWPISHWVVMTVRVIFSCPLSCTFDWEGQSPTTIPLFRRTRTINRVWATYPS